MKEYLKKRLTGTDIFLIAVNIVPVLGVWFDEWSATQAFFVYCLESVIVGLYNVLMMLIATQFRKKDFWETGNGGGVMVSGYGFIVFFIVHYGFFVFLQMSIFLSTVGFKDAPGVFDFVIHARRYLPVQAQWLLLLFIVSNGVLVLKGFMLTGDYKTTSLSKLMFTPYVRVFVQQFCVILGSFFLTFGAGKIFILIFVCIKMFFEMLFDYDRMLNEKVMPSFKSGK